MSGVGVARIFNWGEPDPHITCDKTSSKIFKRSDFLWDKNISESKIRSLGPGLVRKQDVAKGGRLDPKVNVFKICVKFCSGGAVKKKCNSNVLQTGVLGRGPQLQEALGDS